MELEFLLDGQVVHTQINIPSQQVKADKIVALPGQFGKIDLCIVIDAEIIFPAEMDFGPAVLRSQLIPFHYR